MIHLFRQTQDRAQSSSPIVDCLLAGHEGFIKSFFDTWPPDLLSRLAQVNFCLYHVLCLYTTQVWTVERAIGQWFNNIGNILKILESTKSLIAGPCVMRFFDRTSQPISNLDICTRIEGLRDIGNALINERYTFCPSKGDNRSFEVTSLSQSGNAPTKEQMIGGDGVRPTWVDPLVRCFKFIAYSRVEGEYVPNSVTIHLVRWDPFKYVLSSESSKSLQSISD